MNPLVRVPLVRVPPLMPFLAVPAACRSAATLAPRRTAWLLATAVLAGAVRPTGRNCAWPGRRRVPYGESRPSCGTPAPTRTRCPDAPAGSW
jgi:hypothetical protein